MTEQSVNTLAEQLELEEHYDNLLKEINQRYARRGLNFRLVKNILHMATPKRVEFLRRILASEEASE